MNQTQELLRKFVANGSEEAFRELVHLYVDLVYSTALRSINGDAQLAQDICQMVFIDLAQKAPQLPPDTKLGGWLHRDTCFRASKIRRSECSRKRRELEAMEMNQLNDDKNLRNLAPVLDEAINELKEEDRAAILLRFFERLDFRSIGESLGSSEAAAQKRVSRALGKLQLLLKRRGILFSAAALGSVLTTEAVTQAPAAFSAALPGAVLAALPHAGHALMLTKIIAMTKSKTALVSLLLLAAVVTSLVVQRTAINLSAQKKRAELLSGQIASLRVSNEQLLKFPGARNPSEQNSHQAELQNLRSEAERLRAEARDLLILQEKQRQEARSAQEKQTVFQIKETLAAKHDYAQGWTTAFVSYARQNGGQLPKSFEQAESFWPKDIPKQGGNPSEDFEILYDGSLDTLTSLDVVILREKNLWPYGNEFYGSGKFGRHYGIADGHVDYCSSSDKTENGSFENYEKGRILRAAQ
jgi:RNA polymerase sigma factor (sigma-70 family)